MRKIQRPQNSEIILFYLVQIFYSIVHPHDARLNSPQQVVIL